MLKKTRIAARWLKDDYQLEKFVAEVRDQRGSYTILHYVLGLSLTGLRRLHCAVLGHDFVDEGHAGPDSGYTDVSCRRCGFGYGRHYLY